MKKSILYIFPAFFVLPFLIFILSPVEVLAQMPETYPLLLGPGWGNGGLLGDRDKPIAQLSATDLTAITDTYKRYNLNATMLFLSLIHI